ncbi:MAG: pyridoxamine 5'-phosphate oxidase family protein [Oscillatoria sp. PMC 1051.18]|nr:pyridoxamine 5'-phosphate oxidase family protein [Oscillatoria sp. PMC 1050.18]MEC5028607.1 pyridoxamine 5'-phosphate oxidase family protein [Oscillatoria sp. PMC 1051.18]
MKRYSQLNELLAHIWEQVELGATQVDHPYHVSSFATVGSKEVNLRTVILRFAERESRSLLFHSDRRAGKIKDIGDRSRIGWLFWDRSSKQQVRFWGEAKLHFDDELANWVWENSNPQSLKIYLKPVAPNTVLEKPSSGLIKEVETANLTNLEQVAVGRKNFAVIQTVIDKIDFLHLHSEGNYRACFQWKKSEFQGSWLIP